MNAWLMMAKFQMEIIESIETTHCPVIASTLTILYNHDSILDDHELYVTILWNHHNILKNRTSKLEVRLPTVPNYHYQHHNDKCTWHEYHLFVMFASTHMGPLKFPRPTL
jgi:CRISPR/Cas system-associated protein Csx1